MTRAAPRWLLALGGLVVAVATAAEAWGPPEALAGPSGEAKVTRYSIAGGCYALRSQPAGRFVARDGRGYRASASASVAEPFRMQATALGRYLLYGPGEDFMAIGGDAIQDGLADVLGAGEAAVAAAEEPSNAADWTVRRAGGGFAIVNEFAGRELAVADEGRLVAVDGDAGEAGRFTFRATRGCATYPEVEVNATGNPGRGSPRYGEVTGWSEGHMHQMAFEFLGGEAHCGRPWHRFGAPHALVDCPDHEVADGCAAVLENVLYGNPARCHDPVGWPTFADWPHHQSLTHEQSYHRWIERAWRGGLRLYVNLMVENRVLCEVYPYNRNDCNEMDSVLLQIERIHQLQDYIDAQSGGPGKGWYRIVRNPFQARRVINQGKLAVVMGMEVSEPLDCRLQFEMPTCTEQDIDNWIDRLHDLGVRQLEITNKFDNALTGVAGDPGEVGAAVNAGNFYATGKFWDLEHCDEEHNHDHSPTAVEYPHNHDLIIANGIAALVPGGVLPVYPSGPHCNRRGLTDLGEHAIRKMIGKRMIFDPDHQSVRGRNQALDILEAEDYPGVISSHSWSTPNATPRILRLGGVVTPSAKESESFVDKWRDLRDAHARSASRQLFGLGIGADQNGFASQGGPRGADVPNPVTYPFRSIDGEVTLDRQRSGERVYDINVDGVAHYGLYPDWIEDLRMIAGERIIRDMSRGAEAYLQMWERTEGVAPVRCRGWRQPPLTRRGLGGRIRLGARPRQVLERAGQPVTRTRSWRWCAGKDRGDAKRRVLAAFTKRGKVGVVLSTLRRHRAGGVRTGASRRALSRRAERLGGGLWVRDAGPRSKFVYRVRGNRVRQAGVASRALASRPRVLRRHVKLR